MGKKILIYLALGGDSPSHSRNTIGRRDFEFKLFHAKQDGAKWPLASKQITGLTPEKAYLIQKKFVEKELILTNIIGFKAGLTSPASQQKFGVTGPVAGVLFYNGLKKEGEVINLKDFNDLRIETEIGFVIDQEINQKLNSVDELKSKVREIMPAIEFPDLGFEDMKSLSEADLIAADVSASEMIAGQTQKVHYFDPDTISVTLWYNGELIHRGIGNEAMGNQWKAALWVINTMITQGYTFEPGSIIITGALGGMEKGKPGHYIADYGMFGSISFDIQ